jgi:hypothetical protein
MTLTYEEFKKQYKALFLKAFDQTRSPSIDHWDTLVDFEELHPTYTEKLDCYEEWITIFPANKTSDSNRAYFGR